MEKSLNPYTIDLLLDNADATIALGQKLNKLVRLQDCICLNGGLGAGKTTLARGLIQAALRAVNVDDTVPSPTFTLVQEYTQPEIPIFHFDLYRLEDPRELEELGFDDACDIGLALVEWPDRLGTAIPRDRLEVHLDMNPEKVPSPAANKPQQNQPIGNAAGDRIGRLARQAHLTGWGSWADRLKSAVAEGVFA